MLKKILQFSLFLLLLHTSPGLALDGDGSLGQSYTFTKRGLNYVTASHRLTKRYPGGANQPATFVISGLPANAVIEKAYIYASASGNGTGVTLSINNPASGVFAIPATLIGSGADKCWGYPGSHSYRADVTIAISGNGDYTISGFPAHPYDDTTNDTDGATLIIIYSDNTADYEGTMIINDGIIVVSQGFASTTINGIPAAASPVAAKAFTLIGDLQTPGFTATMNGTTTSPVPNFWNYVELPTTITAGQTSAHYTVGYSSECYAFVAAGLLYQRPMLYLDTSPVSAPIPRGSSIDIDFTATQAFSAGNIFTAQLSDASGSFANPINIGTLTGSGSGTLAATIPSTTPVGSGYRIRVIGSDPAIIGSDNGADLSIILQSPFGLDLATASDTGNDNDDNITADQTPAISGLSLPGVTVRLYSGLTEIGSVTADAVTGAWQITSSLLAEGVHTLTATATDASSNVSNPSDPLTITIDASAPGAPAGLDLLPSSDSGINTDNITNDDTPTIGGTAEAGSTIKLYDGTTQIGSAIADATTGAWQITTASLTDGVKSITAKATDAAGNESLSSAALSITIDGAVNAPAGIDLLATSDSGMNTDNITNDDTPTISGTAEAASTVKLYDGASEVGSTTADATTGAWQITSSALTDGVKTITAKATDIAGNESSSSTALAITIDTGTPNAPAALDLLATSDSGINTDNITNDNTPAISGTAEAGSTVRLYDGTTEIGSTTAEASTGTWRITSPALTDGAKTITAKTTDVAGNESAPSAALIITIDTGVPNAPAALDLLATSDSGINTDNITNNDTPAISGNAEAGASIKLYNGTTEIGSTTADATSGAWQITVASLTDGIKSLTAKATDAAGNESLSSTVLTITIDTATPDPPAALDLLATSDSGMNTDNITNDNTPSISGTTEAGATIKLYDSSTEIGATTADATTGAWQITTSSLTDGTKNITAKATDAAGNESGASTTLAITIDTGTPNPPASLDLLATSDSGINTDDITNDNTPAISGTAETGATVKLYEGTTEIGSTTADATTGAWQITTASLTDGTRNITAKATDVAGNESGASSTLTVTIDATAPVPPASLDLLATSDSGIDTDNITNDNTPAISGTADAGTTVKLYESSTEIGSTTADATTGAWQITISSLTDGTKNITAKATDIAGNESVASSTLTITIDTATPDPPTALDLLATSDSGLNTDNITNDNTPTIGGTAETGTTIKFYEGGTEIGSTTADATTGVWQITTSSLTDGNRNITAKATDAAGNESGTSTTLVITIDTNTPPPPASLDLLTASDSGFDTDNITNDNTPAISGTAESGTTVKLYEGTTEIGSTTADATTGAWQLTTSSLTDGTKNITAKATDVAGNESGASATLTLTIDATAPAPPALLDLLATSDSGIDNDNITNNNTPAIGGTAETGASVKLYEGATEIGSATADATTGAWQVTISSLTDGTKNITAKATDIAGNESSLSTALAITVDMVRPAVTLTSPLVAKTDKPFTLAIEVNESITGFTISDILVVNGTASQFTSTGGLQYSVLITPATQGMVTISIPENVATDVAGNGNTSASISREFDNRAPEGYTISFSSEKIDADNVTSASLILERAEVGATYFYSITSENGGEPVTDSGVVATANFTIDNLNLEELENGVLTVTVYLQDDLGHQGDDQTAQTLKTTLEEVVVYTSFSPNGDGINDLWQVPSLRYYESVEIDVFDRAGVRVFHTTDPHQGWDGRNRNGMILTGGYLYIIRVKDVSIVKKGVLTLLK